MRRITPLLTVVGFCNAALFGGEQLPYAFQINSNTSGLNANVSAAVDTQGTLIGNYDATSNPTGTRTKPGLFGPFGPTENLPVSVSLDGNLGGPQNTRSAGGFQIAIDTAGGSLSLSNYAVDLLDSGSISLPASVTLSTATFRTRNPDFLYLGGIPITLPLGNATITSLSVTQIGTAAPGTLTPVGQNRYAFSVVPLVSLTATFDFFGNVFTLPGAPLPLPLDGEILLNGTSAMLTSSRLIDLTNSSNPNLAIPQFPLALPTLGDPANVLADLTLDTISGGINGTLNTNALGTLVPEPASSLAWLCLLACGNVRRRSA